jgi:hypothetical protein
MTSVIYGLDANDVHWPQMLAGERTANHRGLDWIRYEQDPHGCRLKVINTGTLNGTIDPHDPLWALFQCNQGDTTMRLLVITVNWGRGYDPGVFKQNVLRVTRLAGRFDHVVILVQELDEADPAPEHKVFASCLEPGTKKVGWDTHEPIVLSPAFKVPARDQHVVVTMAAGLDLKPPAPAGTGPTRHSVTCIARFGDVELGFGNTHPHRDLPIKTVQAARAHGERVFAHQLEDLYLTAAKEAA